MYTLCLVNHLMMTMTIFTAQSIIHFVIIFYLLVVKKRDRLSEDSTFTFLSDSDFDSMSFFNVPLISSILFTGKCWSPCGVAPCLSHPIQQCGVASLTSSQVVSWSLLVCFVIKLVKPSYYARIVDCYFQFNVNRERKRFFFYSYFLWLWLDLMNGKVQALFHSYKLISCNFYVTCFDCLSSVWDFGWQAWDGVRYALDI